MSNDRIFLRCEGCGGWTVLAKHYPGQLYFNHNPSWIAAHEQCHPRLYAMDLGGQVGFSLHTEDHIGTGLPLDPAKQNWSPIPTVGQRGAGG